MSDLVPISQAMPRHLPAVVALGSDAPGLAELFAFAEDAETRFSSLRLVISERVVTARGEEPIEHEVLIDHPGRARVTMRRSAEPLSREYTVWIGDGEVVRTFDAADRIARIRPRMAGIVGATRPGLPARARLRPALTPLPADTLADTFVHPRGLLRHVLASGPLRLAGTALIADRECFVVEASHPRSTLVLTDRPDRRLTVGLDRMTGLVLLLVESIGETVTRRAEVTTLDLDAPVRAEAFTLHLGPDVRLVY